MGYGGAAGNNKNPGGHIGDRNDTTNCFVATACFGENANITNSLHIWRDEVLI
jgi:hypothetical protein